MNVSDERRSFLRNMGLAAGFLAFAPLLKSCAGVVRADLPQGAAGEKLSAALSPEAYKILECAALAASSHNTQPWRVVIESPEHWILGADPTRRLAVVDPRGRELVLSLGCFLENMERAAEHFGFELECSTLPEASSVSFEIAHLKLRKTHPSGAGLEKLQMRRTLRNGYLKTPLSTAHIEKLAGFAAETEFLYVPTDAPLAAYLKDGALESFKKQSASNEAQTELSEWIRFSDRDARAARDGLTPESMEIGGMAGWYVRNFMKKEDVLSADFRKRGNEGAAAQLQGVGGWFMLAGRDSSTPELLRLGRIYQRMQCEARQMGIAMHPMSQMLEESPWCDDIRSRAGIVGKVQFIVRCGYVKNFPAPVSLRRPPEAFTVSKV